MKCKSISMGFVAEWNTGFLASLLALTLSHYVVGLSSQQSRISRNNDFNQAISDVANASALYSLTADDLATTDCFF